MRIRDARLLALALAACGSPAHPGSGTGGHLPAAPAGAGEHDAAPDGARRRVFALTLDGARLGYAFEEEREAPAAPGGDGGEPRLELRRREVVRFRRGPELVTLETELLLRGSAARGADHVTVEVRHCTTGQTRVAPPASWQVTAAPLCPAEPAPPVLRGPLGYRGSAARAPDGWRITDADGARAAPPEAQPAEWIDLSAPRRDDEVAPRPLFFPARRFAIGRATHHWIDERTWTGEVQLDGAVLESTTALGADARPLLTIDNTGAIAARVSGDELSHELPVVDLVALTTVPIEGPPPPAAASPRFSITRSPASAAPPPPEAPGQRVLVEPGGWRVELFPQQLAAPPASPAELATLAAIAGLARQLAGDEPRSAATAGGGDCTARALRFAAEARRRGWTARLATGFLLDGETLVRHRWAVAWTGARWISVDPSSGDAPAPPDLFALALHDATAEALAAAEVAFSPMRGAVVRWLP